MRGICVGALGLVLLCGCESPIYQGTIFEPRPYRQEVETERLVSQVRQQSALEKAGLLAYAHGGYYALGRQLGTFGWTVRKKPLSKRRSVHAGKAKRR